MTNIELDPRAILAYLNELGYRNISAHKLKEFMIDLKKLIKYEELLDEFNQNDDAIKIRRTWSAEMIPENKKRDNFNKNKQKKHTDDHDKNKHELKEDHKKDNEIQEKQKFENKAQKNFSEDKENIEIKPKNCSGRFKTSKKKPLNTKDPVALHQYYQNEWKRFKQFFPGENDHTKLKWKVRQKLLGVHENK